MRKMFSKMVCALAAMTAATGAFAQSLPPVRIGVLADMSSLYSAIGGQGSIVATQLAVEDYGGKVLGRPVEVISADHQNKPDVASATVRRWLANENVVAITDNATSSPALAVQALLKEQPKALLLTSGAGAVGLVDEQCSPVGSLWSWNTRTVARAVPTAALAQGKKKWFFMTADYAFGKSFQAEAEKVVKAGGGTVAGSVLHPLNTQDFSSYLLQAQASGADIIALANAGGDTTNAIKQAHEFRLGTGKQSLTALLAFSTDIHALGLENAQGLLVLESFIWNRTPETTAFSRRFYARHKAMPTSVQAGAYSATLHFLKAADAAGTLDPLKVMEKMRELPVHDMFITNGRLRQDGLVTHDYYLAEIKTPAESKEPWDYYKVLRTVTADEAFWPLSESKCPLVHGG